MIVLHSCLPILLLVSALGGRSAPPATDTSWLWTVAYHPIQSTTVATGGTDGILRIYTDDRLSDTLHFGGMITEVDWHPGGRLLAVAVQGGLPSAIYDTETGNRSALPRLNAFGVRGIGWSPDGRSLATGDYDGNLTIYDTSGKLQHQQLLQRKGIIGLDWSPDGRTIAAVGEHLSLFDVETGTHRTIADREEPVLMLSVAFHPSGQFLVTGDYGDYDLDYPPLLQFWNPEGERIRRVTKAAGEYRSLEWSQDGTTLAAVSDAVRLYDRDGQQIAERAVPDHRLLWGVSWSPDDRQLLVTDDRGKVYRLPRNLSTIQEYPTVPCR